MTITNVLATVCVTDIERAVTWYERVLGRPADVIPMPNLIVWQVTETGGIQLWKDADHAGSSMVTINVENLDAHVAELKGRDLVGDDAVTTGEQARFATLVDPEGNTIVFAELLTANE